MDVEIETGYRKYIAYGEKRRDNRVVGIKIDDGNTVFERGNLDWSYSSGGLDYVESVGPRFKSLLKNTKTGEPLTLEVTYNHRLEITVEVNTDDEESDGFYDRWSFSSEERLQQWLKERNIKLNEKTVSEY